LKRPEFESFRAIFVECVVKITGLEPSACTAIRWDDAGNLDERRQILEAVNDRLQDSYGVSFEVNNRLLKVDGPVESAIIQAFHELNTIYLMEKINDKIRRRLNVNQNTIQ